MKIQKKPIKKIVPATTSVHTKTALIPFFVITLGLLGFMGYSISQAAFQEPTQLPPLGQPDTASGGGTQNLSSVLGEGANASLFAGPTQLGGNLLLGGNLSASGFCLNGVCKTDWNDIGGAGSVWATSGNNIYNTNTGNVGIGTTSALSKLHIQGATHMNTIIDRTDTQDFLTMSVGSQGSGLHFSDNNRFFVSSDPYTQRNTTGFTNEIFSILPNGNVGIKTNNPDTKLTITPSAYTTSVDGLKFKSADNTVHSIIQPLKASNSFMNLWMGANTYIDSAGNPVRFDTSSSSAAVNVRSNDGALSFWTGNATSNPSARMWIDNAGQVGIGTSTPSSTLEITGPEAGGNILLKAANEDPGDIVFQSINGGQKGRIWSYWQGAGAGLYLSSGDNNADIAIDGAGNVGIGTTTPSAQVHVSGIIPRLAFTDTDAPVSLTNPTWIVRGQNDGQFKIQSTVDFIAFTDRLNIDNIGNVGIGTITPGAKLDVAGQIKITGGSPGAGKVLTSDASGLATWATAGGGSSGYSGEGIMYLRNRAEMTASPANCPSGWSQADLNTEHAGGGFSYTNEVRTCYQCAP